MLNFSLLGYVEVGFLNRYPYPCPQTTYRHKSKWSSSLLALAPAGNQIKLDWAGKLGQEIAAGSSS